MQSEVLKMITACHDLRLCLLRLAVRVQRNCSWKKAKDTEAKMGPWLNPTIQRNVQHSCKDKLTPLTVGLNSTSSAVIATNLSTPRSESTDSTDSCLENFFRLFRPFNFGANFYKQTMRHLSSHKPVFKSKSNVHTWHTMSVITGICQK